MKQTRRGARRGTLRINRRPNCRIGPRGVACRGCPGALLALVIVASTAPAEPSDADVKQLDGRWQFVSLACNGQQAPAAGLADAQVAFGGGYMIYSTQMSGRPVRVTFEIAVNGLAEPRQIDLAPLVGKQQGRPCRELYEVSDDTMTLCVPDRPDLPRPESFQSRPGSGLHL